MLTVVVGAVFFERWFDFGADAIWERMNRGVSDLCLHIFVARRFTLSYSYCRNCGKILSTSMK